MIVLGAAVAGIAKTWALRVRWRDGEEARRIVLIAACFYCVWLNMSRYFDAANYNPVALAQGALYLIPFEMGILSLAVKEILSRRDC